MLAKFFRWLRRGETGTAANPYAGLRMQALTIDASRLGLNPTGDEAWGAIMEIGMREGTVTVVAFTDGTAGVYLSSGGGFIGGGQHELIRAAAYALVAAAGDSLASLTPTASFPRPSPGRVAFYVRTARGAFTAEAAERELSRNLHHPLAALFAAGHGVITAYRRLQPAARAESRSGGIVIIPPARPIVCPACRSRIPWQRVRARLIVCPSCGVYLQMAGSYFRVLYILSLVICGGIAYAIGIHNDAVLVAPFLCVLPTFYVLLFVTLRLFPPDLEPSDDFRAVLYGPAAESVAPPMSDGPAERADGDVNAVEHLDAGESLQAPAVFGRGARPTEHWTFEGILIAALFVPVLLYCVYMAALPVVQRAFPGLDATRSGPRGFPVAAHIGETGIRVENGSDEPWKCTAQLGGVNEHRAGFAIEPRGSTTVPYSAFQPPADMEYLRRTALARFNLICAEPSGIEHYAAFD